MSPITRNNTVPPGGADAGSAEPGRILRHAGASLAVHAYGLRWTYRQLQEKTAARSDLLHRLGLRAGQLVAVPVGTTDAGAAELILMQHAVARADAALLPLAPDMADGALDRLINATGCEWHWRPGRDQRPGSLVALGQRPSPSTWSDDRLALVVQTSGSSGRPKAVMLDARGLLASCGLVNARLGLGIGDRWLAVLPRQHIGGLAIGWRCALAGAAVQVHGRFDIQRVAQDLHRHPITHLSLVPPMLARLLEQLATPPPTLRVVLLGGQATDLGLARRAIAAGWPLYQSYGMTETCSAVAIAGPLTELPRGAPDTTPLPGVELDCPLCPGPPARIRLRGPMLMAGYANPRRSPGDGLDDGWLTTADLGCSDASGGLRVVGRSDGMVIVGGVNVHPGQIEERCRTAPGVDDCAVTAIGEPNWGHRLILIYQGRADTAALERWCRAQLASAQRPRGFIKVDAIPRLPSGKPDRQRLAGIGRCWARPNPTPPSRPGGESP
jgi:O-succinylbenzoic acid--CoA ligase